MQNKVLVGKLVDFYWRIDTLIILIDGSFGDVTENTTELRNMQIELDAILTNISKRWAKGKRERIDK